MAAPSNIYYNASVNATKAVVKASGTKVATINIDNIASNAITYLQLFDAVTANVTVGTTTPTAVFAVNTAAASNAVVSHLTFNPPLYFKTGLVIAATTTATGSSNPSTAVPIVIQYI